MDWDTFKVMFENMLRGVLTQKSKDFKRRVADFLRNLADDLDTELKTTPNKEPDQSAT